VPRPRTRRSSATPPTIRGDEDLTELAVRAAGGDQAAESAFVSRTIDDVWRYCRALVGPAQADDATQATYLRALRSLHGFRAESSARTWVIGVARHTCLDLRRSLARQARLHDRVQAQPSPEAAELHADRVPVELDELLAALSTERREAFVLTQLLGFGYEAAADLLGVPIGTIRSRVARARIDLLGLLGTDADTDAEAEGARGAAAGGAGGLRPGPAR
jgi:RNA polymerase sigma-70 factor (ECF subfamily)